MAGPNGRDNALPTGISTIAIPGTGSRPRYASSASRTGNHCFLTNIRDFVVSNKNVQPMFPD